MSRRVLVGFIVLNVLVSLAVAVIVITYDRARRPDDAPAEGPTQIVILTATPLPGALLQPSDLQATIDVQQLTIQALEQSFDVAQMTAIAAGRITPGSEGITVPEGTALATINPTLLPAIPTDLPTGLPSATPEDDGCIRYAIQPGDTIIEIAQEYGVFPGDILIANGMTEDDATALQVDDVLLIPVEGCAALNTPTPIPSPSNTPFEINPAAPTSTLPPSAANAQVVIADVQNWGDVNNEMVELRNVGNVVNLQGWTLSNEQGDTFIFPEFRLQQGALVRVYTRQGADTPAALYWGRESPAWTESETITLADADGELQMSFRVGETAPLFQEATPESGVEN